MDLARLLGILVVFGVPAIIGGGLVSHLFHSWVVVWIYEILLVGLAVRTAYNAAGKSAPGDHGDEHAH
ncbi:MAG: hypothetical protein JRI70_08795 [Deltaproteobacteria bacterium]|nr:hypothetical protein [Deltaproteobacteria bacterium]MBW2171129.1 hypothetical protein [Deltaproteobacteria bacterium]